MMNRRTQNWKKLGLVAMLWLPSLVSHAQFDRITIDKLNDLHRGASPILSPDGKTVIFSDVVSNLKENRNDVVLMQTTPDGKNKPVAITPAKKGFSYKYKPDGKGISFMAGTPNGAQVFEMGLDGNNIKQVTDLKGGVLLYEYSPDQSKLLVSMTVKVDPQVKDLFRDLDKVEGKIFDNLNHRHWDTWADGTYQHLFVVELPATGVATSGKDIMAGQQFDAPVKPFGGDEQVAWAPDSKQFAYAVKKNKGTEYAQSTNSDIFLYDLATGTEKNLTADNLGYDMDPAFSPDGKSLAYLSMKRAGYESDKNRLMVLDLKSMKVIEATEKLDRPTDQMKWSPDGKTIYAVVQDMATKQIYAYDVKKNTIKALTKGDHDFTSVVVAKDGKKDVLVGTRMSISAPMEVFAIDPKNGAMTQISFTNEEALRGIKLGRVEKRMIKATDGKDILTWVIYPPDFDPSKKYATLLYCQGGPQSAVSQFFSLRWNFQAMAANDYIVVAPNRRGLQSFGQDWCDAIIGDYGGMPMTDLITAIDEVSKEPYVDKNRVGAVGASFGGYTVYWLAGHNESKRFKSFISHCGMYNMESWYGSTEEMFFANNDQKGSYWDNPANYEKNSPHLFAKKWNTPILVIHNEKDFRVPLTQGLEAFTAAQMQGIQSRLLYFPDENHWVLKPQNALLWQRVFFDWLEKTMPKK